MRRFRAAVVPLLPLTAVGTSLVFVGSCAKVPTPAPNPSGSASANPGDKFLYVTLTVRGKITTGPVAGSLSPYYGGNYYFVLINRTDDVNDLGPVPVVGLPWGNGFAAPAQQGGQGFVGMVRYDNKQSSQNGYGVYVVPTNTDGTLVNPVTLGANTGFTYLGPPDAAVSPSNGQNSGAALNPGDENTLSFRVNLSKFPLPPNNSGRFLRVNLLATNNLPQGADDASKIWDALGDGANTGTINSSIRLDTTQNPLVTNRTAGNLEPASDVRDHADPTRPLVDDPNLDIVDFSIEVRGQ